MEDLRLRDKGVIEKTTYCGAGKTVSFLHISYDWSFFCAFWLFSRTPLNPQGGYGIIHSDLSERKDHLEAGNMSPC